MKVVFILPAPKIVLETPRSPDHTARTTALKEDMQFKKQDAY